MHYILLIAIKAVLHRRFFFIGSMVVETMAIRTIGTDLPDGKGYTQTFSTLPFKHFKVVKVKNRYPGIFRRLRYLPISLPPRSRIYIAGVQKNADILHFWNKISFNNQPWVTSLEGALFHYDFRSNLQKSIFIRRLASNSCRGILPFSQCAYNAIEYFLAREHPIHRDLIVSKMQVSRPVQDASIFNYEEKQLDAADITFAMVGDEFFRKGGEEVLDVFDRLIQNGCPVKLRIVSRLKQMHRPFSGENVDLAACRRIIEKNPERIVVTQGMEHGKIIELFKNSHVGLLPSYSENYGFSVLEAQSAGCPVITTDVRAFPEINDDEIGWIIRVPQDEVHDALMWNREDKARSSTVIRESLLDIVKKIIDSPSQIKTKGMKALARLKEEHDPHKRALEMEGIYDAALSGCLKAPPPPFPALGSASKCAHTIP